MSRIEALDGKNWQDFLAADAAVLILAKTDCNNCSRWSAELESTFAEEEFFPGVRFGKLYLDVPGLISFKKANPWIAQVDDLPYNVIYVGGEQVKRFAGGGIDRLRNRLTRVVSGP
jgi:hypothetical protein